MKYFALLLIWCCADLAVAAAKLRVIRRGLDQTWADIMDDSSYVLLRPRTSSKSGSKKRNQGVNSPVSSSRSSNQRAGPSDVGPSSSRPSASTMAPHDLSFGADPHGQARTALMFAAVRNNPEWSSVSPPRERDSRSPSPPRSSVSGHPLSAVAIARGPATLETHVSGPEPPKKINVRKNEYGIANVSGPGSVSAGGHTFQGGSITAAVAGDISAATIEARTGGKGYIINSRGGVDYPPHEIKAGQKFQKAIHSMNPKKENVATLARVEGPGAINAGAAEVKSDPSSKYGYKK